MLFASPSQTALTSVLGMYPLKPGSFKRRSSRWRDFSLNFNKAVSRAFSFTLSV